MKDRRDKTWFAIWIILFFVFLTMIISGCNFTTGNDGLSAQDNPINSNNDPPQIGPPPGLSQNPPPIPIIKDAIASSDKIELSWSDDSPFEDGFIIKRDGEEVGRTDRNVSVWTDTSISLEKTCYAIIAYNKEWITSPSTEKCVTVPMPNHQPVSPLSPGDDLPKDAVILFKGVSENGETCIVGNVGSPVGMMGARGEVFVARYDSKGIRLWLQKLGNPKFAHFAQGVVCFKDALYVLWGENDDETDKIAGDNYDAYVSSYSKEGTLLWMTQVGIGGGMSSNAMADGGDYIFAIFQPSYGQPYINKIDASEGSTLSTSSVEVGKDIAVYGGNVYICGSKRIDDIVEVDIFIYKYDFNGNLIWQRQWGSQDTLIDNANQIFVDANRVVIEGISLDLIPGGVEAQNQEVILKYDFNGNLIYSSYSGEK